jgi:hypothetical protein
LLAPSLCAIVGHAIAALVIMKRVASTLLVLAAIAFPVHAQTRLVVVNNQRLNDVQIAQLDRIQCAHIPNGFYWLNLVTGAWGYAGNPAIQGYLGGNCAPRNRQKSLSERGLLYRPGDLNFR